MEKQHHHHYHLYISFHNHLVFQMKVYSEFALRERERSGKYTRFTKNAFYPHNSMEKYRSMKNVFLKYYCNCILNTKKFQTIFDGSKQWSENLRRAFYLGMKTMRQFKYVSPNFFRQNFLLRALPWLKKFQNLFSKKVKFFFLKKL